MGLLVDVNLYLAVVEFGNVGHYDEAVLILWIGRNNGVVHHSATFGDVHAGDFGNVLGGLAGENTVNVPSVVLQLDNIPDNLKGVGVEPAEVKLVADISAGSWVI